MGVVLLSPVAPLLRAAFNDAPAGALMASAALTAPALSIALFSAFIGVLVDRAGPRRVLIAALVLYGVVGPLPMVLQSLPMILASRFVLGIAEAAILTANFALLGGYYEGDRRDRWIAYKSSFAAAAATGFYVLGGMLGEFSWRAPFAAYAAAFVIAAIAAVVIFDPVRVSAESMTSTRNAPRVSLVIMALFLVTTLSAALFYIVPIQFGYLLNSAGVEAPGRIGFLIAFAGLGNPVGGFAFRFVNRAPIGMIIGAAMVIAGAGLALAASAPTPALMTAAAFINQLGCGLSVPAMVAATLRALPPSRRGVGGGGWSTAFFAGQFLSPLFVAEILVISGDVRSGFWMLALVNLGFAIAAAVALSAVLRPIRMRAGAEQHPSNPINQQSERQNWSSSTPAES